MSTLKTTNIQHPSASVPAITLDAAGAMTGSFPYPNRNLLYNGAMQLHQRGTSASGKTAAAYSTADRWKFIPVSMGTWTETVENDAPTGSGFSKSIKFLCTTADATPASTDAVYLMQILEGQDCQKIAKGTISAQQLTVSFWVKSNVTGTYVFEIGDNDNSRFYSANYTISTSATWEKKTITFPADTTGGVLDNDNNASLYVRIWLSSGSAYTTGSATTTWSDINTNLTKLAPNQVNVAASINNYWQITGVQLETGAIATPFEFKSYGQELRECQRYFYRINAGGAYGTYGNGWTTSTSAANVTVQLPVTMRTTPTEYGGSGIGEFQVTNNTAATIYTASIAASESNPQRVLVAMTLSTTTASLAGQWRSQNNSSGYIYFGAEL